MNKKILSILFLLAIYIPFLIQARRILTHSEAISYEEKRELAELPTFDSKRINWSQFIEKYEAYFSDNFYLRLFLTKLNSLPRFYLFGVSTHSNVLKGENGWFFSGAGENRLNKKNYRKIDNVSDFLGRDPFTDSELQQWKDTIVERTALLKKRGIEYVFGFAPDKSFIYPEYMPESLRENQGISRLHQLTHEFNNIENRDVCFVDLLNNLLLHKKENNQDLLYYKTDSHWNFLGAFYVYQEITKLLNRVHGNEKVSIPTLSQYRVVYDEHWKHEGFNQYLGLGKLGVSEKYASLMPLEGSLQFFTEGLKDKKLNDYSEGKNIELPQNLSDQYKVRAFTNLKAPYETVLIMGTSYSEKLFPFFSGLGKKTYYVRSAGELTLDLIDYLKPQFIFQDFYSSYLLAGIPKN